MPSYYYSALDGNSQSVNGQIEATGKTEAIASLAERSIFVIQMELGKGKSSASSEGWSFSLGRRRVSMRDRSALLQQLATALKAGLTLLEALRVVEEQAQNRALRLLISDLADRVQSGESLSEAMGSHPAEFSRLETSMVQVGETAGVLDEVMGYLSDFAERDLEIREKIRSAATYPVFVLSLAAVSVVVIVTVILPRVINTITASVGEFALPLPTRILLGVSWAFTRFGWLLLLGLVVGIWAFRSWLKRPEGRLAFDRFKLRVPVLGMAIRKVAVARLARTLGTLGKSGIPILEALRVLRDTLGNEALASKIDEAALSITQGESIAEPLRKTGEFPPLLIQVIAMGEKTGKLDELLLQTAQAYEKETAAAVDRVMTILPAVLIVLLALVVAFILAAVLLPIIGMSPSM